MPNVRGIATTELRPTGLMPVPEVPWGEHMALFFETLDDLLEVIGDYFQAGLAGNEKCLWVTSDRFTVDEALERLEKFIPAIDRHVASGAVEVLAGAEWYLTDDELDSQRALRTMVDKTDEARRRGFAGFRSVTHAFWLQNKYWESFAEYEARISALIRGRRMIILCVYPLREARASDVLDVTKAHDFSIARRSGHWEFLESPDQTIARREINRLQNALDILSLPFPGREKLTPRERLTLAQIVRGASNKEAARALDVSPRTVEFHRANILRKLGAKNLAELMSAMLDAADDRRKAGRPA